VPRTNLVLAQTPQIFAREVLVEAYARGGGAGTTDDASVVERAGHTVHVVQGDPLNIKITHADDWRLAVAIMRGMQSN
jgi:2-C-methyl-D-erythritol 4-phosphate cytidylyltransferase